MKARKISWNQTDWRKLYFYQKADALYQLTVAFCRRFLPAHGDRTVDQMVQAARSGKQNIVEGYADGVTSSEIAINLLNVARGSIKELKEDYLDYLKAHAQADVLDGAPSALCQNARVLPCAQCAEGL